MLQKIRLSMSDDYQLARAVQLVAEMVVAHERGEPGLQAVGSEQGAVDGWDDVVVTCADGSTRHHQVKRQSGKFDQRAAVRGKKGVVVNNAGQQTGSPELQERSELDKAFAALARWAATASQPQPAGAPARANRSFMLDLPGTDILIKKDLKVYHLVDLCSICARATTSADGLNALRLPQENAQPGNDGDRQVQRVFDWLTSWCDFTGANDVLFALSRLQIRTIGVAAEVDQGTERTLEPCFHPAADARLAIRHYLLDHGSPAGAATAQHLRSTLEPHRRAPPWTLYHNCPQRGWRVAGTHGSNADALRRQNEVVAGLWGPQAAGELRVAADRPSAASTHMVDRLARLAIHLPRGGTARLRQVAGWQTWTEAEVGDTLGLDEPVVPDDWAELSDGHVPVEASELGPRAEGALGPLRDEMDEHTWNKVQVQVDKLRSEFGEELQNATEQTWYRWKQDLSIRSGDRHKFLASLLHPRSEGARIRSDLRVGLRTADLLGDALALLLVVAAVLGDIHPRRESMEFLRQPRKVRTLALRRWSGPAMDKRRVRGLDDEDGLVELLAGERADILVLSGVEAPVDSANFMCDARGCDSAGRAPNPSLVVTRDRTTRRLCNEGDLEGLQHHLLRPFEERLTAREQNIHAHREDMHDAD